MKTVTISVNAPGAAGIPLGRRGENGATRIVFDVSVLAETYGDGTAVLVAKRPADEAAYPVPTERDGNTVTWTVTSTDTAYRGEGKCELFWYIGEKLAKTVVFTTSVTRDIGEVTADPPDPYESWIEDLTELGAETLQNAYAAADSADDAETAARAAEAALAEFTNPTASAETLAPGSEATARYEDGHFTFGLVQGPKGDTTYYTFSDPSGDGNIVIEVT